MPPPIWSRELNNDKKTVKNYHNKHFNAATNKKCNDDPMISDLLGELQAVMLENAKLQNTNKNLKMTVNELQCKYNDLMESIQLNRSTFEEDLNKLHDEIKDNETQLIENSKMCLQQQKRHIQEASV